MDIVCMYKDCVHVYTFYFLSIADREVQRILLELLNQMDGFDQSVNVKVHNIMYVHTCR